MQQSDMAHVLGEFAKWAIMIAGLGISAVLSYIFYTTITPPDKPWFAYLALGLTEGGFVGWFATFMLSRHHAYFKGVAIIMVVACAIASFIVAGTELNILFQRHYSIAQNASAYDNVILALEVIFAMHVGSIMLELFGMYFARPGNTFRGVPPPQPTRRISEESQSQRSSNPNSPWDMTPEAYERWKQGEAQANGNTQQPKEAVTYEQRATRSLPPARSQGTGFLGRLKNAVNAFNTPVPVSTPVQQVTQASSSPVSDMSYLDDEDDTYPWEKQQAAAEAKIACAGNCGKVGAQGNWLHARGDGNNWYCPECMLGKKP